VRKRRKKKRQSFGGETESRERGRRGRGQEK